MREGGSGRERERARTSGAGIRGEGDGMTWKRASGWVGERATRVLSLITSQDGQERETPERMLCYAVGRLVGRSVGRSVGRWWWCGEREEEAGAGSLVAAG